MSRRPRRRHHPRPMKSSQTPPLESVTVVPPAWEARKAAMQEAERRFVSKPAWQLTPRRWPKSPPGQAQTFATPPSPPSRFPPVVSCRSSSAITGAPKVSHGAAPAMHLYLQKRRRLRCAWRVYVFLGVVEGSCASAGGLARCGSKTGSANWCSWGIFRRWFRVCVGGK